MPSERAPVSNKKILLAEDDPFISRMYNIKLSGAGYSVETLANGQDVLASLRKSRPDLAMIDINLPELTGFEVLARLEAEGIQTDTMKIIILTNSSKPEDQKTAQHFGAEYMIKADYTPKAVLDKVTNMLGGNV